MQKPNQDPGDPFASLRAIASRYDDVLEGPMSWCPGFFIGATMVAGVYDGPGAHAAMAGIWREQPGVLYARGALRGGSVIRTGDVPEQQAATQCAKEKIVSPAILRVSLGRTITDAMTTTASRMLSAGGSVSRMGKMAH